MDEAVEYGSWYKAIDIDMERRFRNGEWHEGWNSSFWDPYYGTLPDGMRGSGAGNKPDGDVDINSPRHCIADATRAHLATNHCHEKSRYVKQGRHEEEDENLHDDAHSSSENRRNHNYRETGHRAGWSIL
jgi:hypothetical protein